METPPLGRNILQRVGTPASTKQERTSPSPERNMNMKQENPTFLVPPLWKDSLSLENIANDFLDSNVTGEVMKLDDFLKELQSSDVQEDMDDLCGGQGMLPQPQNQQQMHDVRNQQQDPHNRYNLIRPANIESLRETSVDHQQHPQLQDPHGQHPGQLGHSSGQHPGNRGGQPQDHHGGGPVRPPIMHHVGKPPELYNHNLQESSTTGIPQASVRPLVRQNMVSPENHLLQNERLSPESKDSDIGSDRKRRKERMRTTSEDSEDDSRSFTGYTSTVCVNFSQDDLRLATIPGQDFDPATRRFSEEELKPQPIIRKRKKQFVPDELKNNKYWAKRSKNNEAAKRSREARRLKENQIAMRARFLEEENMALKNEVENLKKENGDLKQMMVALEEKLNQLVDKR